MALSDIGSVSVDLLGFCSESPNGQQPPQAISIYSSLDYFGVFPPINRYAFGKVWESLKQSDTIFLFLGDPFGSSSVGTYHLTLLLERVLQTIRITAIGQANSNN